MKKPAGSVRFRFYKPKTKKPDRTGKKQAEQNRTEPEPKKTEPNWFEPVFVLKNRTETGWFETVSVRF